MGFTNRRSINGESIQSNDDGMSLKSEGSVDPYNGNFLRKLPVIMHVKLNIEGITLLSKLKN